MKIDLWYSDDRWFYWALIRIEWTWSAVGCSIVNFDDRKSARDCPTFFVALRWSWEGLAASSLVGSNVGSFREGRFGHWKEQCVSLTAFANKVWGNYVTRQRHTRSKSQEFEAGEEAEGEVLRLLLGRRLPKRPGRSARGHVNRLWDLCTRGTQCFSRSRNPNLAPRDLQHPQLAP